MKAIRILLAVVTGVAGLLCPPSGIAQTTPPTAPVVVPKDPNDAGLLKDLKGAPDNVKDLIVNFDKNADKYLLKQRALLTRFKNATTPEDRSAIREQLQDNRQTFLTELKTFRAQLKEDLAALKGKISGAELQRILAAARDATPAGDRHKGAK